VMDIRKSCNRRLQRLLLREKLIDEIP
jgi:hypothetical protein